MKDYSFDTWLTEWIIYVCMYTNKCSSIRGKIATFLSNQKKFSQKCIIKDFTILHCMLHVYVCASCKLHTFYLLDCAWDCSHLIMHQDTHTHAHTNAEDWQAPCANRCHHTPAGVCMWVCVHALSNGCCKFRFKNAWLSLDLNHGCQQQQQQQQQLH